MFLAILILKIKMQSQLNMQNTTDVMCPDLAQIAPPKNPAKTQQEYFILILSCVTNADVH